MTLILQVFYSVFSALILSLGIPNELYLIGSPFFTFISIIPFYIVIRSAKNYKTAFWMGFIQIITTHLCSSFWLAYFKDFAIFTLGASAVATGIIGGICTLFMYLPFSRDSFFSLNRFSLKQSFYHNKSFRILYFACTYTIYEWIKSIGFIGYPWGTISSGMFRWPVLRQIAAITGTYGITFIVVFFDALVVEIFYHYFEKNPSKNNKTTFELITASKFFIVIFSISLIYGCIEYNLPRNPIKTLNTILVQQNSNPWNSIDDSPTILVSENLSQQQIDKMRQEGKEPQLIVWSEGSLTKTLPFSYLHYEYYPEEEPLVSFIKNNNIPLLAGGSYCKKYTPKYIERQKKRELKKNKNLNESNNTVDDFETEKEFYRYYNTAVMFDKNGNLRGTYAKLHLVPFAELIPGIENPIIQKIFKAVVGISAGWSKGEHLTYFDVPCNFTDKKVEPYVQNIDVSLANATFETNKNLPMVRISTPICFDDAFTDVIRPLFLNGAELFINLTDDSWSLKKSSEYQHFVIASYRAIEYRTTLVRSTNAGYSVVVDPSGKILYDMPLFEESSTACEIPVYKRILTTYANYGNWLPYSCFIFFVIVSLFMYFSFSEYNFIPSERKNKITLKHKKNRTKNKSKKNK